MTAETKAKISATMTGRPARNKGILPSLETRMKMSVAKMGNKNSLGKAPSNKGVPMTEEQKLKLSVAHWKGGLKVAEARHRAKRCGMGLVPLNKPFSGADGHHIDSELVIYIPQKLHQSVYHNHFTGLGMDKINAIAYNFLFKQGVEAALEDKREQLAI